MNALQEARARYVGLLIDRLGQRDELDFDLCERIERMLGFAPPPPAPPPIVSGPLGTSEVIEIVARRFQVAPEELTGPRRSQPETLARQLAMRLCRERLGMTYPAIAAAFNRDHSTVMHACRITGTMAIGDILEELEGARDLLRPRALAEVLAEPARPLDPLGPGPGQDGH